MLEKLKALYSNFEGLAPDRIIPTVGLNIGRIEALNTKLVFWDLGGQPSLRPIWEKYYDEAHAVVFVIDAACPSRFEDAKSALEKVLRHEDLRGAPFLVLANKQDLPQAASSEELAQYLDFKKLDEGLYTLEAVSAYDGTGIKEGVEWLLTTMERSKRSEMMKARAGFRGEDEDDIYTEEDMKMKTLYTRTDLAAEGLRAKELTTAAALLCEEETNAVGAIIGGEDGHLVLAFLRQGRRRSASSSVQVAWF